MAFPTSRSGPRRGSTFRAWLFRICRNAIANERRYARRHPVAALDLAADIAAPDDPEATAVTRDEVGRAWRAVDALPDERRQALVLRFVNEMSAREIGAVMGRSEGAVRVLIHRALRAVADDLGRTAIVTPGRGHPRPAPRRPAGGRCSRWPPGPVAADVDPELARTARVVSLALARFHPSFRFEERLAARLRESAEGRASELGTPPSRGPAVVIPFAAPGGPHRGRSRRVNGAIIGGAISAGVSLASLAAGALVARRRGRGDSRWERVI